jgi:probable rRNA maturation factor
MDPGHPVHNAPNLTLQIETALPNDLPSEDAMAPRLVDVFQTLLANVPRRTNGREIEIGVTLTDDVEIRAINKEFRQVNASTDVLSFPMITDDSEDDQSTGGPPLVLGDIVISIPTIQRQASDRGLALHERFTECLVHGFLHLLGWEHDTGEGREKMEAFEDELVPAVTRLLDPAYGGTA